jgi:antimicrobial peptide system SdpA family protein
VLQPATAPHAAEGSEPSAACGPVQALLLLVVSAVLIASLLAAALLFSLPGNALLPSRAGGQLKVVFTMVAGESFPFFTKDPESEFAGAYRVDPTAHTVQSLLVTPQGRPANLLGLSRRQRAQGPELAFLAKDKAVTWTPCTGAASACALDGSRLTSSTVDNDSPVPTLCGDLVLTVETPVPWGYRRLVPYTRRASSVAHLRAVCR